MEVSEPGLRIDDVPSCIFQSVFRVVAYVCCVYISKFMCEAENIDDATKSVLEKQENKIVLLMF
jgi:hypothetical protein